ncbi:MAG: hypothetical protein WC683_07540 [bacterium]
MVYQSGVQDADAVRLGSCKIEVGADVGSLQDFGIAKNVKWKENITKADIKPDNGEPIMGRVVKQEADISFDWMEPEFSKINVLRGGIDTYATVEAAPVSVTNEVVVLDDTDAVRLEHKNAAGTEVGSIVVTGAAGSPTHTRNTDYVISVDSAGYTCIARIGGAGIDDGATVLVDYAYTPASSKTFSTGGKSTQTPVVVRFTNTNESGNDLQVTFYKTYYESGLEFAHKSDEATEELVVPVTLRAIRDSTRTAGDQLLGIVDEQAT